MKHLNKKSVVILSTFLTLLVGVWGVYAATNNVEFNYGTSFTSTTPIQQDPPSQPQNDNIKNVVTSNGITYAITTNGSVYAWGDNEYGQVGNGSTSNVSTPTMIFDSTGTTDSSVVDANISQIVTNGSTTYAITTNGSVYAWGDPSKGEIGNGSTSNVTTPTMIFDSTGTDSSAVDADVNQIIISNDEQTGYGNTTYVITTNGSVYAWGDNADGQVGNGTTNAVTTPTMIFDSTGTDSSAVDVGVSQVVSINGTTYALTTNGSV